MGEKVTDFFCKWLVFATSPAKSPAKSLQTPFVSPTTTTTTTSATSPPVTAPLPVPHTSASKNKTTPMTPATPSSRSVFLSDWWLVSLKDNCGGNRVGVGGRTYNRLNMPREFTSSLIRKRIDSFNLETIDGFTIVIDGPVNEERTILNGFPIEACSRFLMGFPFNWESYTIDYFSKEPIISDSANCSGANVPCRPPPIPQDRSPAIKIEVDDGSYKPTRESSVPRKRSARLMKIEKIETPIDAPASIGKSQGRRKNKVKKKVEKVHQQMPVDYQHDASSLFSSPESLNLRRSRSGRLLVPSLDVQQKLIYDGDGTIIGIMRSH